MARFGSFAPYPRRHAGGPTRVRAIFESLNEQLPAAGGAPPDVNSIRYARNLVVARMLAGAWASAGRLAGLRDPRRTCVLARLERIHRKPPRAGDSEGVRRRRLAAHLALEGQKVTRAVLDERLRAELGELFVGLEFISVANAVVHVPNGSYPWGTVATGTPWYSTVAHVLVYLRKPSFLTEAGFYERAARVHEVLDPLVPVWATFDWYRGPEGHAPVTVPGGPSAAAFFPDDEHNLDNCVFDA